MGEGPERAELVQQVESPAGTQPHLPEGGAVRVDGHRQGTALSDIDSL